MSRRPGGHAAIRAGEPLSAASPRPVAAQPRDWFGGAIGMAIDTRTVPLAVHPVHHPKPHNGLESDLHSKMGLVACTAWQVPMGPLALKK